MQTQGCIEKYKSSRSNLNSYQLLMMTTTEDFLNSKAWCNKMERIVLKKVDIDGDGCISQEIGRPLSHRLTFHGLCSEDKTALEANKTASEKYISTLGTRSDRVSKGDWLREEGG